MLALAMPTSFASLMPLLFRSLYTNPLIVGQLSPLPCVETEVVPPEEADVPPLELVVPPVAFDVPPDEVVVPPVEVVVPPEEEPVPPVEVVVPPEELVVPPWDVEVPPVELVVPPVDVEPLPVLVTCVPCELVEPLPGVLVEPLLCPLFEQSIRPGTAAKISWRSCLISCRVSGEIVLLLVLGTSRVSSFSTVNLALRDFRAGRPDVRGAPGVWGEPNNGNMDPSFTERGTVRGALPRDTVVAQDTQAANQAGHSTMHEGRAWRRRAKPGHTGKAGNSECRCSVASLRGHGFRSVTPQIRAGKGTREFSGTQRQSLKQLLVVSG
jgi:hypothetical protein